MSTISLRHPESLQRKVRELAREEHTSVSQFISTALARDAETLRDLCDLPAILQDGEYCLIALLHA